MHVLMCKLNVLINIFASVIDNFGYLCRFPKMCSSGEFPKTVHYRKKSELQLKSMLLLLTSSSNILFNCFIYSRILALLS